MDQLSNKIYQDICVVKYRRKIFTTIEISQFLKELNLQIALKYKIEIAEQETDIDHIHILFKAKPTANLVKFIQHLKGSSSYELFRKFPKLKRFLWGGHLWSPSYFLTTTGQVSLDVVKKYIENQGKK